MMLFDHAFLHNGISKDILHDARMDRAWTAPVHEGLGELWSLRRPDEQCIAPTVAIDIDPVKPKSKAAQKRLYILYSCVGLVQSAITNFREHVIYRLQRFG